MNILILGGGGYTGTVLTNYLLLKNHNITVVDKFWFGNFLKEHNKLNIFNEDILNIDKITMDGVDAIIHLANISNDPGVELNPDLSWNVNVLSSYKLIDKAVKCGVKQFIFASSGSVYGIKDEEKVTEDLTLKPISTYNKTKMIAERVLISFSNLIKVHCIRPATVCGYSPRLRLDVSVNMLTFQALKNKRMIVFGGKQIRPNIHIQDLARVYNFFLENRQIESGFFNAGFENISIIDIAHKIQLKIDSEIIITDTNDPRSYRQCSDKLISLGFINKYSVDNAISDLIINFKNNKIVESDLNYNLKTMKKLKL